MDDNTDYRIHLPTSGPLVGGITIAGGRRVQIIGGEIDLTYPCSNDGSDCMGIYIAKNSPGAVFVEGVWIHNPASIGRTCPGGASSASQTCSTGDGIDVNTADNGAINVNTITLENIRVDGISGCSGYDDHADVFQPYQAPDDTIQIDRMTGVTNCQGFTLDPDLAYSKWHRFPSSITVKNANIDATTNPYRGTAIWAHLVADLRDQLQIRPDLPEQRLFQRAPERPRRGFDLAGPGRPHMRRPVLAWGRQLDRRPASRARSASGCPPAAISYRLAPLVSATDHPDTDNTPGSISVERWRGTRAGIPPPVSRLGFPSTAQASFCR